MRKEQRRNGEDHSQRAREQRQEEPTEGSATGPEQSSDVTIIHTYYGCETRKMHPWKHTCRVFIVLQILLVPFVDGDVETSKCVKAVTLHRMTGEGEHIWHTGNDFPEIHLRSLSVGNPGSIRLSIRLR